jgi:hypothetical protein
MLSLLVVQKQTPSLLVVQKQMLWLLAVQRQRVLQTLKVYQTLKRYCQLTQIQMKIVRIRHQSYLVSQEMEETVRLTWNFHRQMPQKIDWLCLFRP